MGNSSLLRPCYHAVNMWPAGSLLILALVCAACRPPTNETSGGTSDALQIEFGVDLEPGIGITPISVRIVQEGRAVAGASVEITGDMTHAGMMPVIREAVEVEPGLYRADTFEFTMAGDWFLTAEVVLSDGRRVSEILPLSVQR